MFIPKFYITAKIANILVKIEAIRQEIAHLPITPTVLASLRQTARLHSTHYSTMIEGNRLSEHEVEEVIRGMGRFSGRELDEKEVLGYYAALDEVDKMARSKEMVNEATIKMLHALVISGGKKKVKPKQYRDGQNIIKDMTTRRIVYLPPQSEDVPQLMKDLVVWLNDAQTETSCRSFAGSYCSLSIRYHSPLL